MKHLPALPAACICFLLVANPAQRQQIPQPQHEAITQYKAFMSAARADSIEDAIKLVEPVPRDAARLLRAAVRLFVASVQLRAELTSQFGLPRPKDEDEFGERAVAPAVMENLQVDVRNDNLVVVHSRDPDTNASIMMMLMVRRDGRWFVSADMLTDQDWEELETNPNARFKSPPAKHHEQFIEYAEASTKTIETVLSRLKRKQFKTRAEVLKASSDLMPKANGEIDVDDC